MEYLILNMVNNVEDLLDDIKTKANLIRKNCAGKPSDAHIEQFLKEAEIYMGKAVGFSNILS